MSRTSHSERVRAAARFYRRRGWNPLPSAGSAKRPLIPYSDLWERPVPDSLMDQWDATNVQVMTGAYWRLVVVDCDGPLACQAWDAMRLFRHDPPTWVSRSGGGGLHYWYRLPSDVSSLPSCPLCRLPSHHSAVELLADRRLVMAPPSVHPETGRAYRWLVGPRDQAGPAELPRWVLGCAPATPPCPLPIRPSPPLRPLHAAQTLRYRREDVLNAIPDKLALAESWGLRRASVRPNLHGWYRCRSVFRADRNPSAGFSADTGAYWEPATVLSLFDLGVFLSAYSDWVSALNDLGDRYVG